MGDERPRHTDLQHQHQHDERLRVASVWHVVPGIDHDEQRHDHRQEVQRKADAIEADGVIRLNDGDPLTVNEELQLLTLIKIEAKQRVHTNSCGHRRSKNADLLMCLLF